MCRRSGRSGEWRNGEMRTKDGGARAEVHGGLLGKVVDSAFSPKATLLGLHRHHGVLTASGIRLRLRDLAPQWLAPRRELDHGPGQVGNALHHPVRRRRALQLVVEELLHPHRDVLLVGAAGRVVHVVVVVDQVHLLPQPANAPAKNPLDALVPAAHCVVGVVAFQRDAKSGGVTLSSQNSGEKGMNRIGASAQSDPPIRLCLASRIAPCAKSSAQRIPPYALIPAKLTLLGAPAIAAANMLVWVIM